MADTPGMPPTPSGASQSMTREEIFAETERIMRPYLPILVAWEEIMQVWVPLKAAYDAALRGAY